MTFRPCLVWSQFTFLHSYSSQVSLPSLSAWWFSVALSSKALPDHLETPARIRTSASIIQPKRTFSWKHLSHFLGIYLINFTRLEAQQGQEACPSDPCHVPRTSTVPTAHYLFNKYLKNEWFIVFFKFERIGIKMLTMGSLVWSQMVFTFFFISVCSVQSFHNEHMVKSQSTHISLVWLLLPNVLLEESERRQRNNS